MTSQQWLPLNVRKIKTKFEDKLQQIYTETGFLWYPAQRQIYDLSSAPKEPAAEGPPQTEIAPGRNPTTAKYIIRYYYSLCK